MKTFSIMLLLSFATLVQGQSTYLGLKNESSLIEGQAEGPNYWPKIQIIDSVIYVPTTTGIYRKHLNTLSDTTWQLNGFAGIALRDFVKRDNTIIGVTNYKNDSMLVYSTDDGATFSFLNIHHFVDSALVPSESNTSIYQIAHNVASLDTLLVSHHFGISLSTDTGNTWTLLAKYVPEFQYRFIDFHPSNKNKLFSLGENGFFTSYVYASTDGGVNWNTIHNVQNDCVHHMAFHPYQENTYIIGSEGRISKTNDGGANWSTFDLTPYIYVKEIKYDTADPTILYASGGLNGLHDTVYFLQSIDAGDTWNVIHREMPGSGNVGRVLDFEIIDGGIIYVTDLGGLYYLESAIGTTTDAIEKPKASINLFPNPTRDVLFVSSDKVIETLALFDGSGKTIIQRSIKTTPYTLQLDNLKEGTYYLRIRINDQDYLRKVIKH